MSCCGLFPRRQAVPSPPAPSGDNGLAGVEFSPRASFASAASSSRASPAVERAGRTPSSTAGPRAPPATATAAASSSATPPAAALMRPELMGYYAPAGSQELRGFYEPGHPPAPPALPYMDPKNALYR